MVGARSAVSERIEFRVKSPGLFRRIRTLRCRFPQSEKNRFLRMTYDQSCVVRRHIGIAQSGGQTQSEELRCCARAKGWERGPRRNSGEDI
jgi:hypothetical protein